MPPAGAADKKTEILEIDARNLQTDLVERAGQIIRDGGTCAFPTETVYGLGADGLNPDAVRKIFEAKGRPGDNPLILHIAYPEQIALLTTELTENARAMAEAFWPGPLTLVVRRSGIVPDTVSAGLETVAVRCPSHPVAHALILQADTPIAAPSANLSGSPSPTSGEHVVRDLDGRVDMILVSDDSQIGVESTVVDTTKVPPVILRPGRITKEDLEAVVGEVRLSEGITSGAEPEHPASPGMKYTHYSPRAEVYLTDGTDEETERAIRKACEDADGTIAILTTGPVTEKLRDDMIVLSLGDDPEQYEHNLFSELRRLDDLGADRIFVRMPAAGDRTLAVRDRLMHAAGYRFLPKDE